MQISVWDTYVSRADGSLMHFDILVPSTITKPQVIYSYGEDYLKTKPFATGKLSAKACRFCHMEVAPPDIAKGVEKLGYYIIEMENCH